MFGLSKKVKFWEPRFRVLAEYNSEVARGIIHTEAWKQKMAVLQREYDEKTRVFYQQGVA
jgi:hypothetical protein